VFVDERRAISCCGLHFFFLAAKIEIGEKLTLPPKEVQTQTILG
jgi:hypothetical protein